MLKTVTCPICGAVFETSKPNKKYCGISCRETGRRRLRIKWEEENPHYNAEYMKQYRRQKESRTAI